MSPASRRSSPHNARPRQPPVAAVAAVASVAAVAAALVVAVLAPPTALARTVLAPVPQGFVGVDVDGPVFGSNSAASLGAQIPSMVASGVQSVRVAFNWAAAQPYQSWSQVPALETSQFTDVAGVPTDFQITDTVVAAAARARISVLPTVLYTPLWDAKDNPNGIDTPLHPGAYGAYLTALIGRYGPHGSFWTQNPSIPREPIRTWQIWNEPDLAYFWQQPFAASYVALLRVAHAAIKRADPGAKVVLGALTNLAWKAIGSIYRIRGQTGCSTSCRSTVSRSFPPT